MVQRASSRAKYFPRDSAPRASSNAVHTLSGIETERVTVGLAGAFRPAFGRLPPWGGLSLIVGGFYLAFRRKRGVVAQLFEPVSRHTERVSFVFAAPVFRHHLA